MGSFLLLQPHTELPPVALQSAMLQLAATEIEKEAAAKEVEKQNYLAEHCPPLSLPGSMQELQVNTSFTLTPCRPPFTIWDQMVLNNGLILLQPSGFSETEGSVRDRGKGRGLARGTTCMSWYSTSLSVFPPRSCAKSCMPRSSQWMRKGTTQR